MTRMYWPWSSTLSWLGPPPGGSEVEMMMASMVVQQLMGVFDSEFYQKSTNMGMKHNMKITWMLKCMMFTQNQADYAFDTRNKSSLPLSPDATQPTRSNPEYFLRQLDLTGHYSSKWSKVSWTNLQCSNRLELDDFRNSRNRLGLH